MNLTNMTVLVTGTNRGIGKSIVNALITAGVNKIYACARQIDNLSFEQDSTSQTQVIPLQLDITNPAQIKQAASQATDVNLLINNAGVIDFGNILTVSDEQLNRSFNTNCFSTLALTRTFAPIIEGNKTQQVDNTGAIVNILTLLSLASMPELAAYNAAKAAAWSVALSLRASLANQEISVHNVFPGAVDTDMLAGVEMDKTAPMDVAQAIIEGLQADQEDIFPDPMSQHVYQAWCQDHKAIEKQFAQM